MDSSTQNNATSNSHQPPEPSLCAGGCGFFGSPENRGLCSKCYSDYIKREIISKSEQTMNIINDEKTSINNLIDAFNSAAITEIDKTNSSDAPAMKPRCGLCNKKVRLLGFVCRCGETFCGMHRYPEAHPCDFDFKSTGKIVIEKENPVCKADKILDRL